MAIARSYPSRNASSHPRGGPLPLDRIRQATTDPIRRATTDPNGPRRGVATMQAGGGVVDPTWRPPPPQPPPPAYTPPPVRPSSYTRDPRLDALLRELERSSGGGGAMDAIWGNRQASPATKPLDFRDIEAQGGPLRQLLAQLMRGEGVKVGDLSNDPAQRAYEIKTRREAERLRESEAARSAASGGADAGDFDSRVAQIQTQTGEAISANMADLINKRRSEKLATALAGANLQMSDLQRQAENRRSEFGSSLERERLGIEKGRDASSERQRLLDALMMEDRQRRESSERENYYERDLAEQRRQEEREQAERLRQEALARNPGGPVVPYDPYKRRPFGWWR